jgi:hypothetical protein
MIVAVSISSGVAAITSAYAVRVFLAFTLSQTGMVVHWQDHRDQPHWHKSLVFNAIGATLSGIVFVIEGVTLIDHITAAPLGGARSISNVMHGRLERLALPQHAGHDLTLTQRTPYQRPGRRPRTRCWARPAGPGAR